MSPTRTRRPRTGLVVALLAVAMLTALTGSAAVWLDRQVISNRGWAQTSPRLIANRDVRTAVARFAVDELYRQTHVASIVDQVLPAPLDAPALTRLRALGLRLAQSILATGTARTVWNAANRVAHRDLLADLDRNANGRISLDLTVLLHRLIAQLVDNPLVKAIPGGGQRLFVLSAPRPGQIPILSAAQVRRARGTVNGIRGLSVVLTAATVLLIALAVMVARGWRGQALTAAGVCLAIVGGAILAARALIAPALADGLVSASASAYRPAAKAAWLIGTTQLRTAGIVCAVAGGVLALVGVVGRALGPRAR
jgi:hypothetical protein